ncbi:MAG TPA: hypothetical protein VGN20_20350 [Mucilaginibacter sp.]|jgi:hypothetical protein
MYIFVFESLRKSDPKTGKEVHDFLDTEKIANEFHRFNTKKELLDLLEIVKIKAAAEKIQPFVHFDCHGNQDGIGAVKLDATEEFIPWEDVLDKFIEIYQASQKKSIICMSSCKGFNASRMVAKAKPCPYDHVCGSFEEIGFDEAYRAYTRFYKNISSGISVFDAAVAIHQSADLKQVQFMAVNSQTLFKIMIDGYKADQLTEEKLAARKAHLLEVLKKNGHPFPNKLQLEYLDEACSIEGQQEILDRYKEVFFSFK